MFEELGEGPHYADPQDDVHFGDIFAADFLHDIFAREDASLMGGGPLPPTLAPKVGGWMNTKLDQGTIDLYSPAFPAKPETRYALAHASLRSGERPYQAALLSDSCLTATALAQGRQEAQCRRPSALRATDGRRRGQVACSRRDRRLRTLPAAIGQAPARAQRVRARLSPRNWRFTGTHAPPGAALAPTVATRRSSRRCCRVAGNPATTSSAPPTRLRMHSDAGALTPPLVDRLMDHLRELAQLATDAADQLAAVQSS